MPARRFYARKKKAPKKKGATHHIAKQPSKMTWKQLIKKTPESYTDLVRLKAVFTPLRYTFDTQIAGDGTHAYAEDVQSPMDMHDPSLAVGAGQPFLLDTFYTDAGANPNGLYANGMVKRARITLDYIDASTTEATAYYVFLIVAANVSDTTNPPITTVDDLLESRERRIRPAYSLVQAGNRSTAGGRRRLKIEFDLHKALGLKKDVYDSGELDGTYNIDNGAGLDVWYGLVSVDGSALPTTVKGNFTFRNRYLIKFFNPVDVGPSLSRKFIADERYGQDEEFGGQARPLSKAPPAIPTPAEPRRWRTRLGK